MPIRNIKKSLIGMEDLAQGVGEVVQQRNKQPVTMGLVDVPYAVNSEAEMQDLDVTHWSRARVYFTIDEYTDYAYDAVATEGISSNTGPGFWVPNSERVKALKNYDEVRALNGYGFTQISVAGHTDAGDGGGAVFILDPTDNASSDTGAVLVDATGGRWKISSNQPNVFVFNSVADAVNYAKATGWKPLVKSNMTVLIPSDSATIQDALDAFEIIGDAVVSVVIESGHILDEGFRVQNGDYSRFEVTSADGVVPVSSSFTPVSDTDLDPGVPRSSSIGFLAVRAKMPKWGCIIDMSGTSNVSTAYQLDHGSSGIIKPGCGFINTDFGGGTGCNCRVTTVSTLHGYQAVFTGAAELGIAVTVGSIATVAESDVSNSGLTGFDVSRGSKLYANSATASNCPQGAYVRRSSMFAQAVDWSGSALAIRAALGSKVAAADGDFTGVSSAVNVVDGSDVDVSGGSGLNVGLINTDAFNRRSPKGIVTNRDFPASIATALISTDSISIAALDQVSIAALGFATLLNRAGAVSVIGGSIYGRDVGVRITIDGQVVVNDLTRARGDDSAGNEISVVNIPPLSSLSSVLIEVHNRSGVTADFGARVYWRFS